MISKNVSETKLTFISIVVFYDNSWTCRIILDVLIGCYVLPFPRELKTFIFLLEQYESRVHHSTAYYYIC